MKDKDRNIAVAIGAALAAGAVAALFSRPRPEPKPPQDPPIPPPVLGPVTVTICKKDNGYKVIWAAGKENLWLKLQRSPVKLTWQILSCEDGTDWTFGPDGKPPIEWYDSDAPFSDPELAPDRKSFILWAANNPDDRKYNYALNLVEARGDELRPDPSVRNKPGSSRTIGDFIEAEEHQIKQFFMGLIERIFSPRPQQPPSHP